MLGIIPYWLKGRKKADKGESFSTSLNGANSKIYNIASLILESVESRFLPKVGLTEVMVLQKNNIDKRQL